MAAQTLTLRLNALLATVSILEFVATKPLTLEEEELFAQGHASIIAACEAIDEDLWCYLDQVYLDEDRYGEEQAAHYNDPSFLVGAAGALAYRVRSFVEEVRGASA